MPDTNGGRMLTAPETRLANRAAVSPADRMRTPATMSAGHREPPRRPVTARERTPRPAKSWLGRGVLIAGLAMIPWDLILACSLPSTIRAAHWSTAWAGLDALEAAGLMTTGAALIGRCSWLCLPAAVSSTFARRRRLVRHHHIRSRSRCHGRYRHGGFPRTPDRRPVRGARHPSRTGLYCPSPTVACHGHGTTLRGFLPGGWDHPVASDGTTRRVVPVVLTAFLLGCRQVVGLGGWGGWCSGRSA